MPSTATPQVQAILENYRGQNPGVLANLARLLNAGRLGGQVEGGSGGSGFGHGEWFTPASAIPCTGLCRRAAVR